MELREAIRQRRSIRRYTDAPVPQELLERLLEDACWAPSAENYQPWHFVALTKPEEIALLSESLQKSADAVGHGGDEGFFHTPVHPFVLFWMGILYTQSTGPSRKKAGS